MLSVFSAIGVAKMSRSNADEHKRPTSVFLTDSKGAAHDQMQKLLIVRR